MRRVEVVMLCQRVHHLQRVQIGAQRSGSEILFNSCVRMSNRAWNNDDEQFLVIGMTAGGLCCSRNRIAQDKSHMESPSVPEAEAIIYWNFALIWLCN
jgi:hypothetical protein